jgi:hypothetical protein
MGLYDRDYMRERGTKGSKPKADCQAKLIVIVIIAFLLGFIVGKII